MIYDCGVASTPPIPSVTLLTESHSMAPPLSSARAGAVADSKDQADWQWDSSLPKENLNILSKYTTNLTFSFLHTNLVFAKYVLIFTFFSVWIVGQIFWNRYSYIPKWTLLRNNSRIRQTVAICLFKLISDIH